MQHSESIAAISAALARAQGAIEGAKKDSTNPHFKSKYADLASCWEACRTALSENEIAVVQAPGEAAEGMVFVTTMLCHSSGEWFRETLTIPLAKVDAQGYGSAVTYARRYALTSMVGIAPEDDDANAATAMGAAPNTRQRSAPPPTNAAAPIESVEPAEGWDKWLVAQSALIKKADPDTYLAENKRRINALKRHDEASYNALGREISLRRDAITAEIDAQREAA